MADETYSLLEKKDQRTLPWFDRNILKGMAQFGPDDDGFTVFVTPQAVKNLQEGTRARIPNEAFGQLMGKAFEDEKGCFTIVSGVVYARSLSAGPGHVKLTPEEMYNLRCVATRAYPTEEFVGWTHSHGSHTPYSPIDYEEQQTWREGYNVGILTFMYSDHKNPWAVAYRGPNSRLLHLVDTPYFKGLGKNTIPFTQTEQSKEEVETSQDSTEEVETPQSNTISKGALDDSPTMKVTAQTPSLNKPSYLPILLSLLIVWPLILTLISVFFLLNLSTKIAALESRIANQASAYPPSPVSANLLWNCNSQTGIPPLKVECNGPVGPGIQGWIWDFGDGSPSMNTNSVTHTYRQPGLYVVTLKVATSSGDQNAGSLNINVVMKPSPTPTVQPTKTSGG